MAKKKKKELTTRDTILQWCSIIGALFIIPTVLPPVPWRYAKANSNMGQRFNMYRYYSLFSATSHTGQPVSWMKLRKDLCHKMEQFNRPNPLLMVTAVVAQNVIGTGGAITGCANWGECKAHVSARCSGYITISVTGLFSIFLILIGGICACCTPLLLSQEATAGKKKKKKEAAKQNTMICIIVAFAMNFMACSVWIIMTQSTLQGFKSSGFYPFAPAFVGAYMCGFGTFILGIAMYCGITRIYPIFKTDEKKDDDEEDEEGEGGEEQQNWAMGPPGSLPPGQAGFDPNQPPPGALPFGAPPPGGQPPPGALPPPAM